jgi:hypothetical protein
VRKIVLWFSAVADRTGAWLPVATRHISSTAWRIEVCYNGIVRIILNLICCTTIYFGAIVPTYRASFSKVDKKIGSVTAMLQILQGGKGLVRFAWPLSLAASATALASSFFQN